MTRRQPAADTTPRSSWTSTGTSASPGACRHAPDRWPLSGRGVGGGRASARRIFAERLGRIKEEYPPVGRLSLTGHAHIDLAWLWPLAETRRKIRRTFSSVLSLMDRYPDFTFNQSSAQAYAWIEEDDPALFARIKERVAEGRWEPIGGLWLEPDCQVTGGEAYRPPAPLRAALLREHVRPPLHRRLASRCLRLLGRHPAAPARRGARPASSPIKLNWNEANVFPYDLFEWEGIDGTSVVAHMFLKPRPRLQRQHRPARHPRHLAQLRG